jgi:hypothetical protein
MKEVVYCVLSPEMWEVIPILDDGTGPREYFRDYSEVTARDSIEAKVKAVRTKDFSKWREWQRDGDESLYKGLRAWKKR